ncbi:MAG: hypothetical protein A3F26_03015 [Candidatus Ryanbacteria bacterium RIFCSPHIGHO2_12_FULL_47_12b]|uniref:Bifunctional protein FolD n=2 Tax=Candidatus Ryaniibacteriota TaxID=1817914 RepID=A0A1G2H644_9BACT|nr:MAG: Bifunctional protein FolD [Parcubacteria group bacterium GW2011_GWA2_47_10b]OGZ49731.1 MAG: hypothetical protein A3C83_00565 [Candidatus Ryanbacteria bacterium RIFCSPHIGHO2_02_FULL_47_25]OGZ53166.1 MAG: hypothetical protein A3F26_03015 [Candidatus Ryanbacteria bacterium RIFCSPHIGHO2_12_FULL_47_12b]OGZ55132.1 MAG: hypothetical protein A3J04_02690 [Candidatus Ryanbacteria bacterium RIFCSPLOWO2_02_FULL_47_14]OGZ57937.1 MAG: hypothetical protein A3G60_04275 [Candidatus Ryanbacteria bacteriu
MILLEGKPIAEEIKARLKTEIAQMQDKPRLAIVMVGENAVSEKFVSLKEKFAREIGAETRRYEFPADITTNQLRERMRDLVHEARNDGVIVQLPLPESIDTQGILNAVVPEKDVDVLSARAVGDFQVGKYKTLPPVAGAIKALFEKYGIEIHGKRVVVVGYGRLVGQPVSVWAKREGAITTVIADPSQFDAEIIKNADIVISGAGVPNLIRGEHIKEGAIVVDAATDINFESVSEKASHITPRVGGVGPLTVAFVFENLVALAKSRK